MRLHTLIRYKWLCTACIVLWLLFASMVVFGQQGSTITVMDKATETPMEGAYVKFAPLGANMAGFASAISNQNGQVQNKHTEAVYLEVTYLGHYPITDTIQPGESKVYYLKSKYTNINEVTVTAEYAPDKAKNSVYDVKVIDQEKIAQKGANTLSELLSTELGTSLNEDLVLGTSVEMQGLGGEHVKILIDGVPVVGRQNGQFDLSQINLSNVERIEIVEGPLSAIYGTNALGGVINIITKNPSSKKYSFDLSLFAVPSRQVNSFEQDRALQVFEQANINGAFSYSYKNHSWQLAGGRSFFQGFGLDLSDRDKEWNPKIQYFGDLQYNYKKNKIELGFSSRNYHQLVLDRLSPVNAPYYTKAFDNEYITFRSVNTLKLTTYIDESKSLSFSNSYTFYQHKKNRYFKDLITTDRELSPDPEDSDTSVIHEIHLRGTYSQYEDDKTVTFQMGYEIKHEQISGQRIKYEKAKIGDYSLYASFNFEAGPKVNIQPSMRLTYNTAYEAPLIPSLNIKYKPNKNLTFRTSYGRGFRAPSVKELYLEFVDVNHNIHGNPDLLAEHSNSFQLSANYFARKGQHYVDIKPKLFFNDIKNQITLAQVAVPVDSGVAVLTDSFTYLNINKNRTFGFSYQMNWTYNQFSLNAGYNMTWLYNQLSEDYNADVNYVPEWSVSGEATYKIDKWGMEVALFNKFIGSNPIIYIDGEEAKTTSLQPYNITDLTLSKDLWEDKVKLTVGAKNLFNVKNVNTIDEVNTGGGVHSSGGSEYPVGWGTSVFVGAKLHLSGE